MKTGKNEKLYHEITDIRDDLIEKADEHKFEKKRQKSRLPIWLCTMAAALAAVLAAGSFLKPAAIHKLPNAYAISEAEYPKMAPYPDETLFINEASNEFDNEGFSKAYDAWYNDRRSQLDQPEGFADGLESFYSRTIRQFLSGAEDKNIVYSPLNVYMALGMLAELTDKNSRQQVLDVLGYENMDALRTQASSLWNANYSNDGAVNSILASSLWLNEDINFVQSTMDQLSKTYYASSYQGQMGSPEFNKALQDWLNAQTGGLLKEQAAEIELNSSTVLALATAVYFQAKWEPEFAKSSTAPGTFHAAGGGISCDFMHQSESMNYYWGGKFSAVAQNLMHSGAMWFILPDEGISLDELLEEDEVMDFMMSGHAWENRKNVMVHLTVPKFDVTSQLELTDGLKALGITDVFDSSAADFTPMTTDLDGIYVSQVRHDARAAIDEEGCTAAAYTVMPMDGAGMPPGDEVDFTADRPFLFVITGASGQPLFVGVVNNPS